VEYYDKVRSFSEQKLHDEITRLNRTLRQVNPTSPVYQQVIGMIETAVEARAELMFTQQPAFKKKNEIIELGKIEETIATTVISSDVLLTAIVTQYTK